MFIRKRLQKHTHYITIRILDIWLQLCHIDSLKFKRRYIRCYNCRIQLQNIRLYSIDCRYHQVFCHQLHEQLIQEPSKSCFKIFFIPVANIVNNNRVFPVLVRIWSQNIQCLPNFNILGPGFIFKFLSFVYNLPQIQDNKKSIQQFRLIQAFKLINRIILPDTRSSRLRILIQCSIIKHIVVEQLLDAFISICRLLI